MNKGLHFDLNPGLVEIEVWVTILTTIHIMLSQDAPEI